ncbi:unnamed protein product [Brassica oleracea]
MNRYGASFKFPDDEVIKSPSCLYVHDYTVDFEGSLFVYLKYSSMLSVFFCRLKVFVNVICFLSYTFSIRILSVFVYLFVDLKYSNTVSIRTPSVFVYRQYSNTVSIRIPSVFVYRQYSYTFSIRIPSVFIYHHLGLVLVNPWSLSPFVYRQYSYN